MPCHLYKPITDEEKENDFMSENKKVLKEGTNRVTVVGTLVEKNFEDTFFTNNKGQRVDQIKGTISVRTGENEVHQVRLESNLLKADGTENGLAKGYMTVRDEYVSVADVAEAAKNGVNLVADVISVNGSLLTNEYYGQDGTLKQYQQIKGRFVNRLKETDDKTPRANFEVDIFFDKARPEIKNDDETGRAIVEAWIPTYSSIFPYKFSVVEEGSDFFLNELQRGQTLTVFGNMLNVRHENIKLVEAAFGDPIEEKTVTYVSESLINNAKMPFDEDSPRTFNPELVKERMTVREVKLENQKAKKQGGGQSSNNQPNAFGGAPTNTPPQTGNTPDISNLF